MTEEISMMTNSLFEAGTAANRIAALYLKKAGNFTGKKPHNVTELVLGV